MSRRTAAAPSQVGVELRKPREACGVFGVFAPGSPAAYLTYLGLYALQHRGQESAGIAAADTDHITVVKDLGLVASAFDDRVLAGLSGHLAIGHTRYSTAGSSSWRASQPFYRDVGSIEFALGHNGNLTNIAELARDHGMLDGTVTSDSDLVAELLALDIRAHSTAAPSQALIDALGRVLPKLRGGFSFVVMDRERLVGVRDPLGIWPLCIGELDRGWVLASESPALDTVGAQFVREVEPGEMFVADAAGCRSIRPFDRPRQRTAPADDARRNGVSPDDARSDSASSQDASSDTSSSAQSDGAASDVLAAGRLCVFEFVYFSRPDTVLLGQNVHAARRRMGAALARIAPADADLVIGVPESGIPAAQGYAHTSGVALGDGLVKNRYIGRTFIAPSNPVRALGVRTKLNPITHNIRGRRLIVVDDSIVRGTTTRAIVAMLRNAGATEVHLRISSPPYRWPCFYGMDTGTFDELLAARMPVDEIPGYLGVDSLAYLTVDQLVEATGVSDGGFCDACLTGRYPVSVDDAAAAEVFGGHTDEMARPLLATGSVT